MLFTNKSSNKKNQVVWVILGGCNKVTIEYALKYELQTTNNQAKYEALIASP